MKRWIDGISWQMVHLIEIGSILSTNKLFYYPQNQAFLIDAAFQLAECETFLFFFVEKWRIECKKLRFRVV